MNTGRVTGRREWSTAKGDGKKIEGAKEFVDFIDGVVRENDAVAVFLLMEGVTFPSWGKYSTKGVWFHEGGK